MHIHAGHWQHIRVLGARAGGQCGRGRAPGDRGPQARDCLRSPSAPVCFFLALRDEEGCLSVCGPVRLSTCCQGDRRLADMQPGCLFMERRVGLCAP